jgi:D-alanyl-D-alanine dipeptidase
MRFFLFSAGQLSISLVRLGLGIGLWLGGPALAQASDLVELTTVDPTLRLDIRYATANNFLGFPVYPEARAFLQRDAALALKSANDELRVQGLGLLILDAYRPHFVTKLMWDRTPESQRAYVADPAKGSRHNRGAAVDLTLVDLGTGRPLKMPSMYDDFSEKAHHDYQGSTPEARANRAKLKTLMEKHGFQALSNEWWHYDFAGWENYPISNQTFKELSSP